MKTHHLLLCLPMLLPPALHGASPAPFKELMHESVRARQPVVYARVADHGYGVQYWRASPVGAGVGGWLGGIAGNAVGLAEGFAGQLVGSTVDRIANSGPTDLAQADAERVAPIFDRAAAQGDLEIALTEVLASAALFPTPPIVKTLARGAATDAASFSEDPVLVVELYAALIVDYRGLQVSAIAYELSPAELAANPDSPAPGRVYRNRFDYVSDLLPAPPVKTKEQIKADLAAVKAKYSGRRLTPQEQAQRTQEQRAASRGTTLEKWREPLMDQWLANGGAALHAALKLGTTTVVQLLSNDLLDVRPVEVGKADMNGRRTLRDATVGRYTSIFLGGPFTGALLSEPSGLNVPYCQGTAFSTTLSTNPLPELCAGEFRNPTAPAKSK